MNNKKSLLCCGNIYPPFAHMRTQVCGHSYRGRIIWITPKNTRVNKAKSSRHGAVPKNGLLAVQWYKGTRAVQTGGSGTVTSKHGGA